MGITEANLGMENILFSSLKRPSKSRITEIGRVDGIYGVRSFFKTLNKSYKDCRKDLKQECRGSVQADCQI